MSENPSPARYTYLGDRNTDPLLRSSNCMAVYNARGKCIRGKNGSMLVMTEDGKKMVVIGRLLRKKITTKVEG